MFHDRTEAGRRLAHELARHADHQPTVLAVPRGGVPVAFEIAVALEAPLDLVLTQRINTPGDPAYVVGTIVEGAAPETVVRQHVVQALGVSEDYIARAAARLGAEMRERRRRYLGDAMPATIADGTVIVVDDGIQTGETMQVVLRAVRRMGPRHLVLAVPVAAPEALRLLQPLADAVACLATPSDFGSVARHYDDFPPVSDDEVIELLDRAAELAA